MFVVARKRLTKWERERERKVARVSKLLAPLPRGRGKVVFGAHLQLLIATEGKIERRKEEEVSSRLLQDSRDVLFGGNERFQTKNEQDTTYLASIRLCYFECISKFSRMLTRINFHVALRPVLKLTCHDTLLNKKMHVGMLF